jgi:hypothetical protein
MHQPYREKLKHDADFRVKYKFRSKENGGRNSLPFQGLRCDFSYADEDKIYIIWPEFEDGKGNVILENDRPIPEEGTALMWVINPERREIHKNKIRVGTKCFFWESKITADCEVIEILNLLKNPTK